ncbi:WD40-repeat-containing domain protein [Scenedesmus sp. NREL 46B-D3]|nr:WD40-repeat-containing domain protein [Scenedesmus sp. NREL 46B-D3]
MAMEIIQVINGAHEDDIAAIAFNRAKREVYTAAEGDRAIKVWDLKTGQRLRSQAVHKGMVTCLAYASSVKLLFSGSIDGSIGVWTDKGSLLQVSRTWQLQRQSPTDWPVFSMAWSSKHRILATVSTNTSGSKLKAAAGGMRGAVPAAGVVYGSRQREEDYYGVCHTDVLKCIVITEGGKIFTAGFDRCICSYDVDKLDKPKEAFKRVKDCARSGLTSLAFDPHNNVLLAGSLDGALRVWSVEGRCLDKFEGLSNKPISCAYLPHCNHWWATGRAGKLAALDPRAPAVITEYVAQPNQLQASLELLYAPPGSDLVLAGTAQQQLVVWQYNPHAAHRVFNAHKDWVEGLLVCQGSSSSSSSPDAFEQPLYSFSADGHMCSWELDAEQNCDVYRLVEDTPVADCNVLCLLHLPDQHCIVAGCEDGSIRLHYLDGHPASPAGDAVQLPSVLAGHGGKVTGLAGLPGGLVLSCSEDRSLRVWHLRTMKQLHAEQDAHNTPIQCMEHCPARQEVSTCGMGSKVKVWSLAKPTQPRLTLVLDHSVLAAQLDSAGPDKQQPPIDINPNGKSNMQWLTRSDIDGLAAGGSSAGKGPVGQQGECGLPAIVAEAIAHATEDVPEVTQVRWVAHREAWVTAADDELLRLWSAKGEKLASIPFKGGSARCLYSDEVNRLLLVSTADKNAYLYDLATGAVPLARFQGHSDIISGIAYLQALDCYITSSWDGALRMWKRPQLAAATGGSTSTCKPSSAAAGSAEAAYLLPEDSEDAGHYVSEYEKAHPLVTPKALSSDHTLALLRAIGVAGDDGAQGNRSGGRRGGRAGGRPGREPRLSEEGSQLGAAEPPDAPGSLGAKLQELGRRLLMVSAAVLKLRLRHCTT